PSPRGISSRSGRFSVAACRAPVLSPASAGAWEVFAVSGRPVSIWEETMKKFVAALAAAAAFALAPLGAGAADYPERSITVVVPFSAGGPTDTVTRLVAEAMSKDLGQQIIVENVGGAGGTLGAAQVADANPD